MSTSAPMVAAPETAPARPLDFRERPWAPWVMVASDVAALELALLFGYLARRALLPVWPIVLGPPQFFGLAVGVLVFPLAYYLFGLYPGIGLSGVERLRRRLSATLGLFALLLAWDYLVQNKSWSRGVLLVTVGIAILLLPVVDALTRWLLLRAGRWGVPVVVLGAARTGRLVVESLRREAGLGWAPVALLDDDPAKWNTSIAGVPVLGPLSLAGELAARIRVAVVAMPGVGRERLTSLVGELRYPQVIVIPDLFGLQSLWLTAMDLGGVVGLKVQNNLLQRHNRALKRALDVVLGLPLFLASLPLMALCALWIKRVSPGPAFYGQTREGMGRARIRVWKLRTMHPEAPRMLERYLAEHAEDRRQWERFFKLKNDPRVLPGVGRLLRRTSLDEFPQLWNVLKGEMSLVGPRPFPSYHLDGFRPEFRVLRERVPPGMTGLWQVSSRSDGDLAVQESLDAYYIRNWSLWLDLYLIARTVRAVVFASGAY